MLTKLWNSGAAYREIEAGIQNRLNPSINRVRFERYRFTYSARRQSPAARPGGWP